VGFVGVLESTECAISVASYFHPSEIRRLVEHQVVVKEFEIGFFDLVIVHKQSI
jgi:hypothetical protein